MLNNGLEFDWSANFREIQNTLDCFKKSVPALDIGASLYSSPGVLASLEAVKEATKAYSGFQVTPALTSSLTTVMQAVQDLPTSGIVEAMQSVLLSPVYQEIRNLTNRSAILGADWSWVRDLNKELANVHEDALEDTVEEIMTPEVRKQMAEDISEVLADPTTAQKGFESKYLSWKEQHPFFADMFTILFLPFVVGLLLMCIQVQPGITISNSNIYTEPVSTSTVVYSISVNQNITVIGDAPYYYEVEFVDPETGEAVTGYIYKGNVSIDELAASDEPIADVTESTVEEQTSATESLESCVAE